jgi:hypothetical protein
MQNYRLLELELTYVRPHEIEKKLELARLIREGRVSRPGLRERALLRLSDVLISLGQDLKARSAPLAASPTAGQPLDCLPSGS